VGCHAYKCIRGAVLTPLLLQGVWAGGGGGGSGGMLWTCCCCCAAGWAAAVPHGPSGCIRSRLMSSCRSDGLQAALLQASLFLPVTAALTPVPPCHGSSHTSASCSHLPPQGQKLADATSASSKVASLTAAIKHQEQVIAKLERALAAAGSQARQHPALEAEVKQLRWDASAGWGADTALW
jgi:hypothetical protein